MKSLRRFALIPIALSALVIVGCNMVDSPTEPSKTFGTAVIYHQFCVSFSENRTSGAFQSEIVCDQFQEQILEWLDGKDIALSDVCSLFMVGGKICLGPYEGHDWSVSSAVKIKRTDVPDDYSTLLRLQTVTIPDTFDPCDRPSFAFRGVGTVNKALRDLVHGGNPVLRVAMAWTDVDPEPSGNDPLVFEWEACLDIVGVVKRGGCGFGDDDDDDDDD